MGWKDIPFGYKLIMVLQVAVIVNSFFSYQQKILFGFVLAGYANVLATTIDTVILPFMIIEGIYMQRSYAYYLGSIYFALGFLNQLVSIVLIFFPTYQNYLIANFSEYAGFTQPQVAAAAPTIAFLGSFLLAIQAFILVYFLRHKGYFQPKKRKL